LKNSSLDEGKETGIVRSDLPEITVHDNRFADQFVATTRFPLGCANTARDDGIDQTLGTSDECWTVVDGNRRGVINSDRHGFISNLGDRPLAFLGLNFSTRSRH
jgi:hypothetical protein